MHACMHACVCICYVWRACMHVCVFVICGNANHAGGVRHVGAAHTYAHTHTHTHIYIYIYTHTHELHACLLRTIPRVAVKVNFIYIYTHTYIHTHTRTPCIPFQDDHTGGGGVGGQSKLRKLFLQPLRKIQCEKSFSSRSGKVRMFGGDRCVENVCQCFPGICMVVCVCIYV
jgi:hypothetical protein